MNAVVRQTSTTAVLSLVFGILGWVALPLIGSIVAIICGHVARAEIRRAPIGSIDGDGLAVAGLVLGWLPIAFILLLMLTVVPFAAIGLFFAAIG